MKSLLRMGRCCISLMSISRSGPWTRKRLLVTQKLGSRYSVKTKTRTTRNLKSSKILTSSQKPKPNSPAIPNTPWSTTLTTNYSTPSLGPLTATTSPVPFWFPKTSSKKSRSRSREDIRSIRQRPSGLTKLESIFWRSWVSWTWGKARIINLLIMYGGMGKRLIDSICKIIALMPMIRKKSPIRKPKSWPSSIRLMKSPKLIKKT